MPYPCPENRDATRRRAILSEPEGRRSADGVSLDYREKCAREDEEKKERKKKTLTFGDSGAGSRAPRPLTPYRLALLVGVAPFPRTHRAPPLGSAGVDYRDAQVSVISPSRAHHILETRV